MPMTIEPKRDDRPVIMVLVTDQDESGRVLGRSQREAPETDGEILFTARNIPEVGAFVPVRITQADTYDLMGEMV